MCDSCLCGRPEDDHDDPRSITRSQLQDAADHAGTDVPGVVANMMRSIAGGSATKAAYAGCQVIKSDSERRYTLGLSYPSNRPDVGKAADGYRDFAGTQAVEEAAWAFMRKGAGVGLAHRDGTDGHGVVVESYIYRGPDWHIKAADGSEQLIKAGDWLLGVQWDPPTWDAIKAGIYNGFSPQGGASRRQPSAEALANLRSA